MASDVLRETVDVLVIGAGISGIATAKCMREAGHSVILLERTSDVGGLWTYRECGYGVMKFTHINVSKHNYCFSDYPFPSDVPDYPHNVDMANYIKDYFQHFSLNEITRFHRQVDRIEKSGEGWTVTVDIVTEDEKNVVHTTGQQEIYEAKYVAIATGHHAKPSWPSFPGQDTFTGEAIHSVSYKDATFNKVAGKKVVVVGIGNSAVDVAANAVAAGQCSPVYLSTRSGAWVVPNYIFGCPTDHYACRFFLALPWRIATLIFESVIMLVCGNPKKWKLNPRMHALQTQPTVSPTLIHHIQRGEVKIVPNIQRIEGKLVHFSDGSSVEADTLVFCTGYQIDLPFLSDELKQDVMDKETNSIKLFKNVFNPKIGPTLAFIGFVQPASGGVLSMSETQARWFAQLCNGSISLPAQAVMEKSIQGEMEANHKRYFASARHTIQRDPITYNDEISGYFGAKPEMKKHPWIAWRLLLGSCGAAQWRLQGPHKWQHAEQEVCKVPVTGFILYTVILAVVLLAYLLYYLLDELMDFVFDD